MQFILNDLWICVALLYKSVLDASSNPCQAQFQSSRLLGHCGGPEMLCFAEAEEVVVYCYSFIHFSNWNNLHFILVTEMKINDNEMKYLIYISFQQTKMKH